MKRLNQQGSSQLVLGLLVLVVAGVGFVGYRVTQSGNKPIASSASVPIHRAQKEPAAITSSAQAKQARQALEASSTDGSLNPAQLDSDLDAVL